MDSNMQLPELRKLAKERGLKNISKLKKNELIELLEQTNEDEIAKEATQEIENNSEQSPKENSTENSTSS